MPPTLGEKPTIAARPSELRQDIVSGDWVTIATGRAKRPHAFAAKRVFTHDPVAACPFDDLKKSGNEPVMLIRKSVDDDWSLAVVTNKYPAFTNGDLGCPIIVNRGPYNIMEGRGFHEVIILRDHYKSPAELSVDAVAELFGAYADRYRALKGKGCVNYIAIFHNHGPESGATLTHPHSQLIAIPVIPPGIERSLDGSERYYDGHRKCVHCLMVDFEKKEQSRIVFENSEFLAVAPYISRSAFEIRIFPKAHKPHFEETNPEELRQAAETLRMCLWKLFKGLDNPSYNFFIHTAPAQSHIYDHYHWHIEIIPKTQIWAGFEIGTGIEISTIDPDAAAEFLRSVN